MILKKAPSNFKNPRILLSLLLSVLIFSCGLPAQTTPTPDAPFVPAPDSTSASTQAIREPTKTPLGQAAVSPLGSLTATNTPGENYPTKIFAAILFTNGTVALVSREGEVVKTFAFTDGFTPLGTVWPSTGCELQIVVTNGLTVRLLGLNLFDEELTDYYVGGYDDTGRWRTWPSLSPSGEWIAYTVWSGDFYYADAEFHDVEVIRIESPANSIELTTRGGAWVRGGAWSPDGNNIAYGDYDSAGIAQIYISGPDGTASRQITHFTDPQYKAGPIKWALNGQALAFVLYRDDKTEDMVTELWITAPDGSSIQKASLDEAETVVGDLFWWSSGGERLFVNTSEGLSWIDAESGLVIRSLSVENIPGGTLFFPFPIQGTQIIGFQGTAGNLYQYDFETDAFSFWADWDSLTQDKNNDIQDISVFQGKPFDIMNCAP